MQFNKYSVYTVISAAEKKKDTDSKKIIDIIEEFSKIKTKSEAKDFLAKNYKITRPIKGFVLSENATIDVKETKNRYSVRIFYEKRGEKECVIYSYNME